MKANRKFTDEEAVSPVIGVILMVAITVILAAVIAAFVFGMGSSLKKQYTIAATASSVSGNIVVITYNGGADADQVMSLNASLNGTFLPASGNESFKAGVVGSQVNFQGSPGRSDHVVVTATFQDNNQQLILDTYV
jgi:flagellin-like protein